MAPLFLTHEVSDGKQWNPTDFVFPLVRLRVRVLFDNVIKRALLACYQLGKGEATSSPSSGPNAGSTPASTAGRWVPPHLRGRTQLDATQLEEQLKAKQDEQEAEVRFFRAFLPFFPNNFSRVITASEIVVATPMRWPVACIFILPYSNSTVRDC